LRRVSFNIDFSCVVSKDHVICDGSSRKSGADVYVQKPISADVEEGRAMLAQLSQVAADFAAGLAGSDLLAAGAFRRPAG
jgi:hypothetical protein